MGEVHASARHRRRCRYPNKLTPPVLRLKTNFAWFLRGIAKRMNTLAERMDPVKLNIPVVDPFTVGSRRMAHEAILRIRIASGADKRSARQITRDET